MGIIYIDVKSGDTSANMKIVDDLLRVKEQTTGGLGSILKKK